MFSLLDDEVSYEGQKIFAVPATASETQLIYSLLQADTAALVYVKSGDVSSKFDAQDPCLKVYLLNDKGLVKKFVRNGYRCRPVIGFIRNYFLLYDLKAKFGLYDFNGRLVKRIKYDFEMLHGLEIIDNDYFIVHRWVWHPFFLTDIYNLNLVLNDGVDDAVNNNTAGVGSTDDPSSNNSGDSNDNSDNDDDDDDDGGREHYMGFECYQGPAAEVDTTRYTRDWCVKEERERQLISLECDRKEEQRRLTLIEDFCNSDLLHLLFKQDANFKYVVFEGDSSPHLGLLEQHQIKKLGCIGGLSGANFECHLRKLVKFEIPANFHVDMILLLGYKLSDYSGRSGDSSHGGNDDNNTNSSNVCRPIMTPFHIDQIITINDKYRVRIKNVITADSISEDQLNYDNFQPWSVTFYVV